MGQAAVRAAGWPHRLVRPGTADRLQRGEGVRGFRRCTMTQTLLVRQPPHTHGFRYRHSLNADAPSDREPVVLTGVGWGLMNPV